MAWFVGSVLPASVLSTVFDSGVGESSVSMGLVFVFGTEVAWFAGSGLPASVPSFAFGDGVPSTTMGWALVPVRVSRPMFLTVHLPGKLVTDPSSNFKRHEPKYTP